MFTWARRKLIGAFFLSLLFGTLTRGETVLAAERILYIPLDDRPVNLAYTVDTFKKAGVDVVTPPSELLSSASRKGNPDALGKWPLCRGCCCCRRFPHLWGPYHEPNPRTQ